MMFSVCKKKLFLSTAKAFIAVAVASSMCGCLPSPPPPPMEQPDSLVDCKPIVNVYLENSGSMDGYVKGQTEFEQIVYNYLVNLTLAEIPSQLNLYYINSRRLPQQDDVSAFIAQLEPALFKEKGGNRGVSDISQMIDTIMNEMNDSTVSIFISDCIFSPGKGKDAGTYLNNQQIGIKKAVGQYFNNHPQLAVMGYRCMSSFDGIYYDKNDAGAPYKGERPFYIWLFGTQRTLNSIQNEMLKNNYQLDGVQHDFVAFAAGSTMPGSCYAIKMGSGVFDLKKTDPKHSIVNLKADKNGKVRFSVEVNYAPLILSDTYLCDASMYQLNDSLCRVTAVERIPGNKKYSHVIHIEAESVHPSNLEIQLCTRTPDWPDRYNEDDGNSMSDSTADKTFGIKYMANGIAEAIVRKSYYTKMIININK